MAHKHFVVIDDWVVTYPNPIKLRAGDQVRIEKREADPEWAGWVFCVNEKNVGGWVSEKYLRTEGSIGTALRDYDATELAVKKGHIIKAHSEEFGWVWAENALGQQGWVPLRNLKPSQLSMNLETERLILRRWMASDSEPFSKMNSDPSVMEFLPKLLSRAESDDMINRLIKHFEERGFGYWALEMKSTGQFIGFTGLVIPNFSSHFTPCVEVGWRLAREFWGKGYATEAARAALSFGFEKVGLKEIVSFTVPANQRSISVMENLGMKRNPMEDFDHPKVPEGSPLRRHVLYRVGSELQ
jgi:RimJ/RimL family protein N-acetyltransferase